MTRKKLTYIGNYCASICEKGVNESFCGAKEGEVFYTVKLKEGYLDTLNHAEAIQISLLLEILRSVRLISDRTFKAFKK